MKGKKSDEDLLAWAKKNRPKQYERYNSYRLKESQLGAEEQKKAAAEPKKEEKKKDVLPKKKEDKAKEESKKSVKDISKDIIGRYTDSRAAKKEKKAREKAKKEAKKRGEPLAPNGDAYEENDIKYLVNKGYSRKDAMDLLSKDSKYTTKYDEAPNGRYYTENDIKYLTDHGYSREDAIKYLSKTPKYKKETLGSIISDNKDAIKEASGTYINKQVDKLLDKEIEKYAAKFGMQNKWSDETKEKIRAMIRGEQNIVFANDAIIRGAQKATEDALNKVMDKQVKERLNGIEKMAQGKLDDAISKVQALDYKYLRLKTTDIEKMLNGKIESSLKGASAIQKYSNTAASLDKKLSKLHINAGLQQKLGKSMENLSANISKTLAKKLQPQLEKQRAITKKVTDQLQAYKKKVTDIKNKALKRIESWKNEAQARIKAEEKKLINSALGSLSKNLKGIKLKF